MYIEEIGERGLIRRIQRKFSTYNRSITIGIGDDSAIIKTSAGKSLLFSTDTLREGIHFLRRYYTFYDMGWKAVAVSVSDIAAMGGVPKYLLLSMALPSRTCIEDIDKLLNGVADITKRFGISLIGGNLSRSKGGVSIDTTMVGELPHGRALLRSGASAGDLIYVSGVPGKSAIGLSILKSASHDRLKPFYSKSFIVHHLRPIPRVKEGFILGKKRLATAAIDISDGLLSDLARICEQSDVGASIYSNLLPLPEVPKMIKKRLAKGTEFYALYGGEDYELLFTVKRKNKAKLETICKEGGLTITYIGDIMPPENGITLIGKDNVQRILKTEGYDHFRVLRV